MDIIHALILSVVEGITEFLPISSTGHLILASHALGIPDDNFVKSFEIIIQLGAILAVVILYWKTLLYKKEYWPKLFLAFLPTAIVGFTLYPFIKKVLFSTPLITLSALLIGGVLLIVVELLYKEKEDHASSLSHITNRQAILIGIFQSLSIIPGVSRAAATIIGGMLVGTKRKTAVEFSFLLAVPTMAAATSLDLLKNHASFTQAEILPLLVGFIGSFLIAILAIKTFLKIITKHTFIPFGIYRIVLAIVYYFTIR